MSGRFTNSLSLSDASATVTIFGAILQKQWDKAVIIIRDRVNYNRSGGLMGSVIDVITLKPIFGDSKMVSLGQVSSVESAYYNLVKSDNSYPEYDAYNALQGDKGIWTLIYKVAEISGVNSDIVRDVLDQLEYATKDNSIPTFEFYKPRTFETGITLRQTPEGVDAVQNSPTFKAAGNLLSIFGWLVNNMVPVLIIGGGGIVLWKTGLMAKGFDYVKGKVSGHSGLGDKQDSLFGPEYDAKKIYILYKTNDGTGITTDWKKTQDKYDGLVKRLYSSTDYEAVKAREKSYVKTNELFDRKGK